MPFTSLTNSLSLFLQWYIQSAVATNGTGLYEGLDWLSDQLSKWWETSSIYVDICDVLLQSNSSWSYGTVSVLCSVMGMNCPGELSSSHLLHIGTFVHLIICLFSRAIHQISCKNICQDSSSLVVLYPSNILLIPKVMQVGWKSSTFVHSFVWFKQNKMIEHYCQAEEERAFFFNSSILVLTIKYHLVTETKTSLYQTGKEFLYFCVAS